MLVKNESYHIKGKKFIKWKVYIFREGTKMKTVSIIKKWREHIYDYPSKVLVS